MCVAYTGLFGSEPRRPGGWLLT